MICGCVVDEQDALVNVNPVGSVSTITTSFESHDHANQLFAKSNLHLKTSHCIHVQFCTKTFWRDTHGAVHISIVSVSVLSTVSSSGTSGVILAVFVRIVPSGISCTNLTSNNNVPDPHIAILGCTCRLNVIPVLLGVITGSAMLTDVPFWFNPRVLFGTYANADGR
ncbi:hypothetical protein GW750_03880 [bacterium]|nr:hypothetical protein [bacterium]